MNTNVKADNNVPFQANRPRFNIVGINPSLIIQRLAATVNFDGKRPTTSAQADPSKIDPAVSAGKALWSGLNHGGIFFLGGNGARPLVVESYYAKNCTATMNIVAIDDPQLETTPTVLRAVPAEGSFKLGPNECIAVTSTGASGTGAEVGFVVRLEGQKIL